MFGLLGLILGVNLTGINDNLENWKIILYCWVHMVFLCTKNRVIAKIISKNMETIWELDTRLVME